MSFRVKPKGFIEETGLSHSDVAKLLGCSRASVTGWINRTSAPITKNRKRYVQIMEKHFNLGLSSNKSSTPPSRYVRVSFPVQTLSDVLVKTSAFGECVIEEEGELYKITKLGSSK